MTGPDVFRASFRDGKARKVQRTNYKKYAAELVVTDTAISGPIVWRPAGRPEYGDYEITINGAIKDGVIGGTWELTKQQVGKEQGALPWTGPTKGTLRGTVTTEAALAKANALPTGKDWPQYYGPNNGSYTVAPGGTALVTDPKDVRLAWRSEEFTASGQGNANGDANAIDGSQTQGGGASPVVSADGKVYVNYFMPAGTNISAFARIKRLGTTDTTNTRYYLGYLKYHQDVLCRGQDRTSDVGGALSGWYYWRGQCLRRYHDRRVGRAKLPQTTHEIQRDCLPPHSGEGRVALDSPLSRAGWTAPTATISGRRSSRTTTMYFEQQGGEVNNDTEVFHTDGNGWVSVQRRDEPRNRCGRPTVSVKAVMEHTPTSIGVLLACGLSLATTVPVVAAEDKSAPVPTTKTIAPEGAYHTGRLRFVAPGRQALDLLVSFRNGQGAGSTLFVDGKYFSPALYSGLHQCRVDGLQFDGRKLSGEFKWRPKKEVETIALSATVADSKVTGKAGTAELTGWLRTSDQMQSTDGFAPGKDWTMWTGSKGDWTGADADRPLVTDPKDARLVWFSEETFGSGRDSRDDPKYYVGGYCSPILGDGRLFMLNQEPVGELVDETVAVGAPPDPARNYSGRHPPLDTFMPGLADDLDPMAEATTKRGARYMARVEAQDVVFGIDAASGATLWKTTLPSPSFMPAQYNKHADDNRTGCFADGKLFALGRTCVLYCLDGATGKLLWLAPVPKAHASWEKKRQASIATRWMVSMKDTSYPPLHHAGGVVFGSFPEDGLVAFDASSGKPLWTSVSSSPGAVWTHDGRNDIVFMSEKGLTCVEPKTGTVVWEKTIDGSPAGSLELRLLGSHLICAESVKVQDQPGKRRPQVTNCYLLEKDGPRKLWSLTDEEQYLLQGMHSASARNGVAYIRYMPEASGLVKSKVLAVELATGKILGRQDFGGTFIGMIEVSSGWVLVHEDGCHCGSDFAVYTERDLKKVGMFKPTHVTTSSYDSPMAYPFVDGRIILRGRNRLFCYDLRAATK